VDLSSLSLTRWAGIVLVLATVLPALITIGVALFGDIRAVEAMFRDLEPSVGHRMSLQLGAFTWAAWALGSLAGFVVLAFALADAGSRVLPTLAVVGFAVFATAVAFEAAFHVAVTSWAVGLLEDGHEVPDLYGQLKGWLNVSLQIIVNPLAVLAYVAIGIAILQTGLLPAWVGWLYIAWVVTIVFPLPLLITPAPVLLGIALLTLEPAAA
jgi:hypothetical protein